MGASPTRDPGTASTSARDGGEPADRRPTAFGPAERRLSIDRLEKAAATAARDFSFPLGLAALVVVYLVVQRRLDARDPKLARAPLSDDDDLVAFR